MASDVKKWTLNSASALLGAVLGAAGVFAAVLFFASDTKNLAEVGAIGAKENAAQIVQLNKTVVESIRDLTAKIESQNQQAVALASRVGAAEKAADAASLVVANELRPQVQSIRDGMVRSQADVAHLSDGIRDLKNMLAKLSEQMQDRQK